MKALGWEGRRDGQVGMHLPLDQSREWDNAGHAALCETLRKAERRF